MATELSLDAALRDRTHALPDVRNVAVRNLAAALLETLGVGGPVWDAARADHPSQATRIDEVVGALETAVNDPAPQIRGLAAIGLGQLGQRAVVEIALAWLADESGTDDAAVFLRECAVIALSMVGVAAAARGTAQGDAEASELDRRIRGELERLLASPFADVRFQAGPALIEVGGAAFESSLIAALADEENEEVCESHVRALASLDPPGPAACDALARLLVDGDRSLLGYEAALALAAARRPEGGPRLVDALTTLEHRDRALEALAVLGATAPPELGSRLLALARGWMTPGMTRVRAAYALARVDPPLGLAELERLSRSFRPSIREGVEEARSNLALLAAREREATDPYRASRSG